MCTAAIDGCHEWQPKTCANPVKFATTHGGEKHLSVGDMHRVHATAPTILNAVLTATNRGRIERSYVAELLTANVEPHKQLLMLLLLLPLTTTPQNSHLKCRSIVFVVAARHRQVGT